ncbi:MAG: SDR family oxidoreductase [Thermoplasmata archaeon]
MIRGKRILVTGGAGFIGSHLAERLCQDNDVVVIDNLSAGYERNLSEFGENVDFVEADIRDNKTLREVLRDVDVVFHCAAQVSVEKSVENPLETNEINVEGTLRLLWECKRSGVGRLIFPSSAAVYGFSPEIPKREDMHLEPESPYAASKIMGEQYCRLFDALYDLPTVVLRCFNVYGPRQNESSPYASVIPRFISAILKGEKPKIFGNGKQTRDFIFIDDVVKAFLLAATKEDARGQIFNIASGKSMNILDLLKKLGGIFGKKIEPEFEAERPGDVRYSLADITKASTTLGFLPRIKPADGLRRTVGYFKRPVDCSWIRTQEKDADVGL